MSSKAMRLKSMIKNYAKANSIAAQVVLQNYMFECFLVRLSVSEYSEKFVVKGGMLIAAIVGLDIRATMDLDTTLCNLPLTVEKIIEAVDTLCKIDMDDDVIFTLRSVMPIRQDDLYGGYRVRLDAFYDTVITPLSVDISTGDVITPNAVQYQFSGIFDEKLKIKLWGYNIETVLAEKMETILCRGIFNTRMRDFYDIYILVTTQNFDKDTFQDALEATAEHRGSTEHIADIKGILQQISESNELKNMWKKYQKKFIYAKDISFENVMEIIWRLVNCEQRSIINGEVYI